MSGTFPQNGSSIPAITGEIDHKHAIHVFPERLQPLRSSIIAYAASLASTLVGYPMDTVKVRMQTHKHFSSYFDCFLKTYQKEGFGGFFRGVWAPLISTSLSKSLSVSIYTQCKPSVYNTMFQTRESGMVQSSNPFLRNLPVCFGSGFIAGGCVSLFACPFEFIKIFAQLEKLVQSKALSKVVVQPPLHTNNTSTFQIVYTIVKYGGWTGLYSGFKLHFLRDSISTGMYYTIYESMKWSINEITNKNSKRPTSYSILLAGGLSGVFSWILIFPIDTAKSLAQKNMITSMLRKQLGLDKDLIHIAKTGLSQRKSYRGLGIAIARSFITNMVFFGVFELSMMHFI